MFRKIIVAMLVLVFFFVISGFSKPNNGPSADIVIKNAKIITIDKNNRRAEAIAMVGEFIVGVGSNSYIEQFIEQGKTRVIDAKGRLVTPGFNDAHAHFGPIDPNYIDLRYVRDPNIITERVREKVKNSKPGELIRGGAWEHEMFYNKQWPTKELIDPVSPDNPVYLNRADGHSCLVNSYILKASGITKDTPDPFGGTIVKDPVTGEPTGIFKESAKRLIKTGEVEVKRTPVEERERTMRNWQAAIDMAARLGVTSIQHPGGGNVEIYQKFKDLGKLTLRVDVAGRLTTDPQELQRYDELRKKYPPEGNWIRFGILKGFIDGTLGSGTMMVFEPSEDETGNIGLPQMSYEELVNRVVVADKMDFQIAIHAIGTRANNWILNAFETAQNVNGKRDSRHRSEHAQILIFSDIPRFAELGVIASMQPTHCITDKRFAEKRIGKERCKGAYAWRWLLDSGAKIAFGTDYNVEPLDPLEGLYAGVTRKDRLGEPGPGWFPEQLLSLEETIDLYTLGSAYAQFMEDRKGMLKKDYLADMVIFNKDLTAIPPEEIMNALVDYTIVGGKIVYKREGTY